MVMDSTDIGGILDPQASTRIDDDIADPTLILFGDYRDGHPKVFWNPPRLGPPEWKDAFQVPWAALDLWSKAKEDYYEAVDEPKKLPFFLHPLIGREKVLPFSRPRDLLTPAFTLRDGNGIPRKLYATIDAHNAGVGALGGVLVGLATPAFYFKAHGPFAEFFGITWLQKVEAGVASPVQKLGYGSLVASRMVKRALVAGLAYDLIKRNMEMESGRVHWLNSSLPAFFLGGVFGIRGGYPTAALGAFSFGLGAMIHHIFLSVDKDDDKDY